MGLDNGIRINKKYRGEELNLPWFVEIDEFQDICYWRKCWGIRDDIVRILHMGDDGGEQNLDAEDIPAIIRVIKKYITGGQEYWDENGRSIWEFSEIKDRLLQSFMNLLWLKGELERREQEGINDFVYFYDSY